MKHGYRYVIWLFVFSSFSAQGQSQLYDTLYARNVRGSHSPITIPAFYKAISTRLNLTETIDSNSFSIRLWRSGMFGHSLCIVLKRAGNWEVRQYNYISDSSINEGNSNSKTSTDKFVNKLLAVDFSSMVNQIEIKDFEDNIADGVWYTLEILSGKGYKVVQYHSPASFDDKENKRFCAFLKLVE